MTPAEIIATMMEKDAFSQWLGIQIDHISTGKCQLSMEIRPEMLNGFGIAHGGISYSLADSCLAFASNSHGRQSLSIDTSINHIEPLVVGDKIIAIAKEESLKNRFSFYRVEILRGETLVALFKGTVYRTEKGWDLS
jgi:acyl-CoA thioesterase